MAKSSINFAKAKAHSNNHNFRKDKPNYLLPEEFHLGNYFWKHEKSEQKIFDDELSKTKRKGGRKPKLENSKWEAVLNLNKNHTLEDVKKVAIHVEKKFNIICTKIAIHRDEGHIENGKPHYNFHAHINFVTYKDGRQNWRKEHIKPSNLSELQTEVAELLQMERGQINSKAVRLDHKQYKAKKQKETKELAKQKDLKTEIAMLRAELQKQGAVREQYAGLEALNRELKDRIKSKNLTIEELQERLTNAKKAHRQDNLKANEEIGKARDYVKNLKNDLSEARETILKHEATIYTQKQKIELLEANINELEHKVTELESELKGYRGKDRQQKRRVVKDNKCKIKEAKQSLKSQKSELSSLYYPERSEINVNDVEQFITDSTGADRKKAKNYLNAREDFYKFVHRPDWQELEDINIQELEKELLYAEQELLEAGFKPSEKNQAQAFDEIMTQINDENDIENDEILNNSL